MSIKADEAGMAVITSVFDWETGSITPAILADSEFALHYDLTVDENGDPTVTRIKEDTTPEAIAEYTDYTKYYHKVLFANAPDFERSVKAAKDARHLWFALKAFRGDDPESYFGKLGAWAEERMEELGVQV